MEICLVIQHPPIPIINHQVSTYQKHLRQTVQTMIPLRKLEKKKQTIYFNLRFYKNMVYYLKSVWMSSMQYFQTKPLEESC